MNQRTKITDPEAETSRAWLESVLKSTGMRATPLAKEAGIAPSTLIRALDADNPTALERRTMRKIADKFGVPMPGDRSAPGLEEPELLPYEPAETANEIETPNEYDRIVNTRALELAGYLPGDIIHLDMAAEPQPGDAVDAQVYAMNRMGAETVFRLYDPPYLVTRTADPASQAKPLLVDGERVRIAAVVLRLQRFPRKSAASNL